MVFANFAFMKPIRNVYDRILSWANDSEETLGLMEFASMKLPEAKRTDIKRWMKYGHFRIDGTVTTPFNAPVPPGGKLEFNSSRPFVVFHNPKLQIVYEDDDVIVVNKSAGLLSVSTLSHKKEENAYEILRNYVKECSTRNKLFIVHRLDRDTSGLMMFAKSQEAQDVLRHNWNNMILERLYVAVLEGYLEHDEGYVKSRLAENSEFVVYSTDEPEKGKLAVTHYRVLGRGRGMTLAEFSLDTGRKNQIRVHCKDLGHPIIGDKKYGATKSPLHRMALHARTLRFAHPITRKDMNFELPVPQKFASLIKKQK